MILLQAKLDLPIKDIDVDDENRLDDVQLMEVEADAYWMLSRVSVYYGDSRPVLTEHVIVKHLRFCRTYRIITHSASQVYSVSS